MLSRRHDVLLIGAARLQSLTPTQREIVREAALVSYHHMNALWSDFEVRARAAMEAAASGWCGPRRPRSSKRPRR
jgi:TRAP-type C4-dicarboxylate transport system substrate-binding protein